jgi:hypothetical protein
MGVDDESREQRARARAGWPIQTFALGQEPPEDLSAFSVAERIALVERLTQNAWAAMGAEIPEYTRSEMPGRVVRRGDAP